MNSKWHEFIERYKEQIPFLSLRVILESFYYYLHGETNKSDDNMGFIG